MERYIPTISTHNLSVCEFALWLSIWSETNFPESWHMKFVQTASFCDDVLRFCFHPFQIPAYDHDGGQIRGKNDDIRHILSNSPDLAGNFGVNRLVNIRLCICKLSDDHGPCHIHSTSSYRWTTPAKISARQNRDYVAKGYSFSPRNYLYILGVAVWQEIKGFVWPYISFIPFSTIPQLKLNQQCHFSTGTKQTVGDRSQKKGT